MRIERCSTYLDELRTTRATTLFLVSAKLLCVSPAGFVIHRRRKHLWRTIDAVSALFFLARLGDERTRVRSESKRIFVFIRLVRGGAFGRARQFQQFINLVKMENAIRQSRRGDEDGMGKKQNSFVERREGERTEERMTIDAWLSPLDVLKKPSVSSQAKCCERFHHRHASPSQTLSVCPLKTKKQNKNEIHALNHAPGTEASYRSGEAFRDTIESRRAVQSLDDP